MFSFLLTVKILGEKVDAAHYTFLLQGGTMTGGAPKPAAAWLEEKAWAEVINLAQMPKFAGLDQHITNNLEAWRKLYDAESPESTPLYATPTANHRSATSTATHTATPTPTPTPTLNRQPSTPPLVPGAYRPPGR